MRDTVAELLANRAKDVAARPKVTDPRDVAQAVDKSRRMQLEALRGMRTFAPTAPARPKHTVVPQPAAVGHTVVRKGPWYSLIGPDGKKVGKGKRTEAEAWAILEGGE